jgi:putative copper resistance protein D
MMLDAAEVASRFLHYAAVTMLFGAVWFFFRELPAEPKAEGSTLRTPAGSWLIGLVILAIASGLAWFAFTTARITQTLSAAVDPQALADVLRETDFGPLWSTRILLTIVMFAVLARRTMLPSRSVNALHVGISAALLASLALTGHARAEEGAVASLHVLADALHLLAAGLWLGGLLGLFVLLTPARSGRDDKDAIEALRSFAGTGSIAVATLIVTGVINTALLVGSIEGMVSTTYGRLLLCKLALFIAMLSLAAANRFALVPHLCQPQPLRVRTLAVLKRHVLIEQIAGLGVLMIVSVLGALAPPAL